MGEPLHGFLRGLKNLLVGGGGRAPRRVLSGLLRGLVLDIDPAYETQIWLGLWERETYPWLRRGARRCRWAVDVGAGKGELCVYLLRRTQAQGVLAFEPLVRETEIFRRNLELNGLSGTDRLRISNQFVGAASEPECTALDSLDLNRSAPGLLKVDVEGAEADVLRSGHTLLREAEVGVLVETHAPHLEEECRDFLKGLGYRVTIIPNAWWRVFIPEHRPVPHNRWLWAERPAPSPRS